MFGRKKKPKPQHVYSYVGEHRYVATDEDEMAETRQQVSEAPEISGWIARHGDEVEFDGSIPACYIIDTDFRLWIASRYSEHVVCARGNPVLAAGEIFFGNESDTPTVERITNQSTGYCPRPSCWEVVAHVLDQLELTRPEAFDPGFVFRWCRPCGNIEIVKDSDFTCLMCGADLPEEWNIDQWEPPTLEPGEEEKTDSAPETAG